MTTVVCLIAVVLLQVLVCNGVCLCDYATPYVIVYAVLCLPLSWSRGIVLTLAFVVGLIEDMFTNTPGVSATALLVIGYGVVLLRGMLPKDNVITSRPSMHSLGVMRYSVCSLVFTAIYTTIVVVLTSFSMLTAMDIAITIVSSTVLTWLFLLTFGSIR